MIRVGVVRGGISHKYDQSLETGATILKVLRDHYPLSYKPVDILITKDGTWHISGRPINSQQLKESVDVIWNALHGMYGEDGALQAELEALQIPYTGSGPLASALTENHDFVKQQARKHGLKTHDHYTIPDYRFLGPTAPEVYLKEHAQAIFLKFSPPWIIKSRTSPDIIAKTRGELLEGLRMATRNPGEVIVEEYITGKQAVMITADKLRDKDAYTFLPIGTGLLRQEKELLEKHTQTLYNAFGIKDYGQFHFTVTPKHIYFGSVRTHPEITTDSYVRQALADVGMFLPDFVGHVLERTLAKNVK